MKGAGPMCKPRARLSKRPRKRPVHCVDTGIPTSAKGPLACIGLQRSERRALPPRDDCVPSSIRNAKSDTTICRTLVLHLFQILHSVLVAMLRGDMHERRPIPLA